MKNKRQFAPISEEKHKELEEKLVDYANTEFCKRRTSDNFYELVAELTGYQFTTYMHMEELKESARIVVDITEELKNINNTRMNRIQFRKVVMEKLTENRNVDFFSLIGIWEIFATEKLKSLISELNRVRRVGGAAALLIINPIFFNALFYVYERVADLFDQDEYYEFATNHIFRAALKMHSDEYKENNLQYK